MKKFKYEIKYRRTCDYCTCRTCGRIEANDLIDAIRKVQRYIEQDHVQIIVWEVE